MTPQAPNFFFPWAKRAKFCQKVFVLFPWCPFLPCRGSASFSALKKCPGIAHHFFEKNQKCPRKLSCRNSGGVQKQGPLPIMGKTFFGKKKVKPADRGSPACVAGLPCSNRKGSGPTHLSPTCGPHSLHFFLLPKVKLLSFGRLQTRRLALRLRFFGVQRWYSSSPNGRAPSPVWFLGDLGTQPDPGGRPGPTPLGHET